MHAALVSVPPEQFATRNTKKHPAKNQHQSLNQQGPNYPFKKPVALLNDEQLDMISQSSAIQEMLKNDGLRRLVRMIDSSENPEYLLDKARKDDRHFMEFSDEILAVIAREPGQSGTDQVLEAMGMGEKP
ncbi:hypothetical protein BGZ58_000813 [Dissophora ornata]|nr:hypothetical protein BGZ58_000813 [Dissophora ornata]